MAATAWTLFDEAKRYIGDGTIDLDATGKFRLLYCTSGTNASTLSLSTLASLTNHLASGNGYTRSGKSLAYTWSIGASTGVMRWDVTTNPILSGNGGAHNSISHAVIIHVTGASAKATTNKLLCVSKLSTSSINVSDGSTLTITMNASGVFELT